MLQLKRDYLDQKVLERLSTLTAACSVAYDRKRIGQTSEPDSRLES